jgi:hypothetical protein
MELVELPLGKVIYESGGHLEHVYSPSDSIVSLLHVLHEGDESLAGKSTIRVNRAIISTRCRWVSEFVGADGSR